MDVSASADANVRPINAADGPNLGAKNTPNDANRLNDACMRTANP